MADQSEKDSIKETAHWQTERRDKMAADGLRSLLLLNGGGAVALLAFLQAIWTQQGASPLVPWVLIGIIPLLLGAALSGWIHFARIDTSVAHQMAGQDGHAKQRLDRCLTKLGFSSFLVGMAIVVAGGLLHLPA